MRNGIKNIDWKSADISLVGEASDGELAYPMILDSKPDILLTDIKMPFMDGLELSERVKRELPDIQIIILSGFDDFTYAQKAVSLGVTEYLLKPVTPQKLLETVTRVKERIEDNRRKAEDPDFSDGIPEEKRELKKNNFFRHLVMNTRSSSELLDMADQIDINLTARFFCIILMTVSIQGESGDDYSQTRNELQENIENILKEQTGWTFFDRAENGFAMLVARQHEESIRKSLSDTLLNIENETKKNSAISYYIAVGPVVNRVSEIGHSYEMASRTASYRFLTGMNRVVYAHDLPKEVEIEDTALDFNSAVTDNDFREVLVNFLRTGTSEETEPLTAGMFYAIGEQNLKSKIFLTYILMDMYLTMLRFAREIDVETDDIDAKCGDIHELLKKEFSPDEARQFINAYLDELLKKRDSKKEKRFNSALYDAVAFIDKNYCDEDISLVSVASIANISPNHLSAIFSQEMGTTFMEYLTEKRMKKARELLMTTEMRSSEIGYEVGYRDPHYFSHTFKKNLGMTPKEFRTRGERKDS